MKFKKYYKIILFFILAILLISIMSWISTKMIAFAEDNELSVMAIYKNI